LSQSLFFTTDLIVDQFAFKKDTIGIQIDNKAANTYNTSVSITGQDNLVDLNGTYKTGREFRPKLGYFRLNLKSIQGFTLNNLKESTGFFTGNFKITGNTDQPKLVGDLLFNDIGFKVTPLTLQISK
jgi:autotransporter translocation and assembly factor TamB